jgi:hypothetical protein
MRRSCGQLRAEIRDAQPKFVFDLGGGRMILMQPITRHPYYILNTRGHEIQFHGNLPGRAPEGAGGEFGPTLRENQQKYGNIFFGVPCGLHTLVPLLLYRKNRIHAL